MSEPKNFGELFKKWIEYYDKLNLYPARDTLKHFQKEFRAFLQHFKSEEEHKLEETRKHGTLFSDYSLKECEIYMYAYVLSRIDDLGGSMLTPKKEATKPGSSGRHMGESTDEFLIEK